MNDACAILIPAHDEADYLPTCLNALLASDPVAGPVEVIVIANGCRDNTAEIARQFGPMFSDRNWRFEVIELAQGNKLAAWNAGEAATQADALVYLDADVSVAPPLIAELAQALTHDAPTYASGRPNVTTADDPLTRAYTRFWLTTPFLTRGVPGFGVFAMNRAGRARWGLWPDIISDDTFARLNFAPAERISVAATYDWPMVEGFSALVRVRRRQDIGVAEVLDRYPSLGKNDDSTGPSTPLWRRAVRDPLGFVAFAAVRATIRLPLLRSQNRWERGR